MEASVTEKKVCCTKGIEGYPDKSSRFVKKMAY